MPNIINRIKQGIVRRIASSHLAGPELKDAVRIYHLAAERGWSCTLGYWTDPSDTPKTAAQYYTSAIQTILNNSMNCYLSIKLPALNYDFQLLKDLLDQAQSGNIRVHFDGMSPDSASPTLKLIEHALATHRNLGYTIPSRWRRSILDTERIIDFGIPVRVVKGQWTDPVKPGPDSKKNFLEIVNLLAGRAPLVAIATHDRKLANKALQRLIRSGSPCEMEQLSSLPQNCASLAKSFQVPMRIYIPYGFPSLPYNLRYVRTRPAILGWVLRDFLLGGRKLLSPIR